MTFEEYGDKASNTRVYDRKWNIMYPALKLCGEAGEVAEKIGKWYRDKDGKPTVDDIVSVGKELGDVLWYINALAKDLGLELEDVAVGNLNKLKSRADRGMVGGAGDDR